MLKTSKGSKQKKESMGARAFVIPSLAARTLYNKLYFLNFPNYHPNAALQLPMHQCCS